MKRQCLHAVLGQAREAENAALVLRYTLRDHESEASRKLLFEHARQACSLSLPVYEPAFERWKGAIQQRAATQAVEVSGRFITGLGSATVLETGIRLHPVYGTPLIPGSGLKGLAAHYAHCVWGKDDADFLEGGAHHTVIFGTTTESGLFRFHDAWIFPSCLSTAAQGLLDDVMTPHHSKYKLDASQAPTDFDSPVPVPFLSVAGEFLLAIEPGARDTGGRWTSLVMDLLLEALETWGAGGKTRTGYGRFRASGKRGMPNG